jgi:16S rRNA (uracil1498-N3)-methyltransferase
MKMFILPEAPDPAGLVRLTGGDYHYLARVRRMGRGALFQARLPSGEPVRVQVRSLDEGCLTGLCLPPQETGPGPEPSLPPVLLFQALPKGAKMDLIVRQAAEGGITEIVPFAAAHSVPKPEDLTAKLRRWNRIIKEARQQSGSAIATAIQPPATEEALLAYWDTLREGCPGALGLLLHQAPLEQGTFHGYLGTRPGLVAIAVGPEGGFSPQEAARFLAAGFKPLVMGDTILRTETAALYAAAAIRIILLESASWLPSKHPQ